MYLFSAIKDALFSNRRSSVGGQTPRYSEPGMRRSSSEGFLLPQFSPSESERDGPVGTKAKRVEPEQSVAREQEPKRRRTTVGGESERVSSRLSIDRADVPSLGSRCRLPSPLPRSSLPGHVFGRRDSLMGSPMSVGQISRMAGSPRASSRPHTPTNPRFVDLLRRDPSQQRALDSARSILDTLDRVTSGSHGGGIGGSAKTYRPPQPLRPMRFKSLSTASRPVSLHEMLTGAASAVPVVPSPLSRPATAPLSEGFSKQPPGQVESPRHGLTLPTFASKPNASPLAGFTLPIAPAKKVDSPRHGLSIPIAPTKKVDSPRHGLSIPIVPVKPSSPMNKVPSAPPKGTFIWGDPSKVSDADFIDEEGFAPGADSSGSDVEEKPAVKKPATDVSSIFGKPKTSFSTGIESTGLFDSSGPMPVDNNDTFGPSSKSIFGTKPTETASPKESSSFIFGQQPSQAFGSSSSIFDKNDANKKPEGTIFGNTQPTGGSIFGGSSTLPAVTENKETGSIFGQQPSGESKKTGSLFGQQPTGGSEQAGSIFGQQPTGGSEQTGSIFGKQPAAESKQTGSIFGQQPAGETKQAGSIFGQQPAGETKQAGSIFGQPSADTKQTGSSIFGESATTSSIFGQSLAAEKKPDTPSAGMFVFGATPPASPHPQTQSSNIFGSSTVPAPAQPQSQTNNIFGSSTVQALAQPQTQNNNIFGTSTVPASQPSIFGQTGSLFGQSASTPGTLFGQQPSAATSSFGFGAQPPGTPTGGLFGSAAAPAPSGNSIFGGEQSSSAFSFGASAGTPTSSGGNPFAASGDEFKNASSKRKIVKAQRRT